MERLLILAVAKPWTYWFAPVAPPLWSWWSDWPSATTERSWLPISSWSRYEAEMRRRPDDSPACSRDGREQREAA
jgi:hypothetical protein